MTELRSRWRLRRDSDLPALDRAEIAAAWLDDVYEPVLAVIRAEGLERVCSGSAEGDLFLCVWRRRRELLPELGCEPLESTVRRMAAGG